MSVIATLVVNLVADVDEYKNNINQAQEETDKFAKGTKSSSDEAGSSLSNLVTSYKDVVLAAAGVVAVGLAIKKGLDETVGEFMNDALAADKFSAALSMSSEESSRLIEIGKSLGIESNELQMDLFRAIKGGMEPTVKGLADMADQYNALAGPQEKADFLQRNFGRSSQDLVRLLQEGSAGIMARSAAVQKGMIFDTAAIQKAQDYEKATNALNEEIKASKVAIGEFMVRPLTDLLKIENQAQQDTDNSRLAWMRYVPILQTGYMAYRELAASIEVADNKTNDILDTYRTGVLVTTTLNSGFDNQNKILTEGDILLAHYGDNIGVTTAYQEAYNKALDAGKAANEAETLAIAAANDEIGKQAATAADMTTEYKAMSNFAMGYTDNVQKVADAHKNLKDAEQALIDYRKAHPWDTKGIEDANGKVGEARQAIADLETAEYQRTQAWIVDVMESQLAVDGLTSKEMAFLLQYQVNTGLITADAAKRAQAEYEYAMQLASIEDKVVNVTTIHTDIYNSGYTPPGHKPGDVKVPGHYEDLPYPHWVPTTYWAQGGPVMGGQMGVWNEDPETRPEMFVGPEGGGYILTKQDAQDALWDKLKKAFGDNLAQGGGIGGGGDTYITVNPHYYKGSEPTLMEELKLLAALRAT